MVVVESTREADEYFIITTSYYDYYYYYYYIVTTDRYATKHRKPVRDRARTARGFSHRTGATALSIRGG